MPHRTMKEEMTLPRSKTFPQMCHSHRSSSEGNIVPQGFSSVQSFPTKAYSSHPTNGDALCHRSDVSNYESNGFTNYRHVAGAGETSTYTALEVNSVLQTDVAVELNGLVAEENQNQHHISESQTSQYLCLYRAALEGNWQVAENILKADRDIIRYSITQTKESVLHIAFASKHMSFVKKVVQLLNDEELELRNQEGETSLFFAAKSGIVAIAKEMVMRNNRLPLVRSKEERTPLHKAALLGLRDMVSYLFTVTSFEGLSPSEHMEILVATITNDMYDIALEILKKDRRLATANNEKNIAALNELARKPTAIGSKSQLSFWKRCLNC